MSSTVVLLTRQPKRFPRVMEPHRRAGLAQSIDRPPLTVRVPRPRTARAAPPRQVASAPSSKRPVGAIPALAVSVPVEASKCERVRPARAANGLAEKTMATLEQRAPRNTPSPLVTAQSTAAAATTGRRGLRKSHLPGPRAVARIERAPRQGCALKTVAEVGRRGKVLRPSPRPLRA